MSVEIPAPYSQVWSADPGLWRVFPGQGQAGKLCVGPAPGFTVLATVHAKNPVKQVVHAGYFGPMTLTLHLYGPKVPFTLTVRVVQTADPTMYVDTTYEMGPSHDSQDVEIDEFKQTSTFTLKRRF